MKLATMTGREQVLVLITAAVFLGGAYGILRYKPALKALAEMQASTAQTEERLKTSAIPDAPDEDEESMRERILKAEDKLAVANKRLSELEEHLPPVDAQEVKLKISELAQLSRLLVRDNEAYKIGVATNAAVVAGGGNSRVARRAARASRKDAGQSTATNAATSIVVASSEPSIGLEMLGRYANPDLARPLQRLRLEGYYTDIRYFLDQLQNFPWQVTVAQMQIKAETRPTEPGMPQLLQATLILAL